MRLHGASLGFLLLFSSSLSAASSGSKSDFRLTPPIPPEAVPTLKKPMKGTLQISYRDGKITSVKVLESTNNEKLDEIAVRHVQERYQMRPGVSGMVKLPFLLTKSSPQAVARSPEGDFIKLPSIQIPNALRQSLPKFARTSAEIQYSSGQITQVNLIKTTGNSSLDRLIIHHIIENYRVKPGAAGWAMLPITVRL